MLLLFLFEGGDDVIVELLCIRVCCLGCTEDGADCFEGSCFVGDVNESDERLSFVVLVECLEYFVVDGFVW